MEENEKKLVIHLRNPSFINRFGKIIVISFVVYIYTLVNSLQDIEPLKLSDRVIESLYFKGKKVFKIVYDDLEKKSNEKNIDHLGSESDLSVYYTIDKMSIKNNTQYYKQNQNVKNYYFTLNEDENTSTNKYLFKAIPLSTFQNKMVERDLEDIQPNQANDNKSVEDKNVIFDFDTINSYDFLGKDLYSEVINENINYFYNDTNENYNLFEFNLKTLYGNRTSLNVNNWDLEKLVQNNILSNNQAYEFWEELVRINKQKFAENFVKKSFSSLTKYFFQFFEKFYKDNKIRTINNPYRYNSINDPDLIAYSYSSFNNEDKQDENNDVYIFNILPTKSTGWWIFASLVFIINYNILNIYNNKDKSYPLLNLGLSFFCLLMAEHFYAWKIYLTANLYLIQFIYSFKCFLFSVLLFLGYRTEDFDIFSEFPKASDTTQIILQTGSLCICTFVLGIFTFYRYNYIINYVFFYYCLLQIPYILSINFHNVIPVIFQPFRYFLNILLGFINLILIHFGRNRIYHTNNPSNKLSEDLPLDSFYIIGDLFTIFCFSYIFDYLFIQSNRISVLFQESEHGGYINKNKLNEKITKIIKNYKELIREFELDDSLWIFCFKIGFFLQYIGLKFHKYIIYYFSYYYFRMVLGVYGRIFTVKCLKFTYSVLIFILLITNFIMSSKVDNKLFETLKLTNSDLTNILRIFCRLAGVINIIALIFLNHEYISIEFYQIFLKKETAKPKETKMQQQEEEEESETDYSELLNDENFENFLKDCKMKFKNNIKNLYTLLNKERNDSINDNEQTNNEELEIDDNKIFPDELDEIIEERIRDKYFKDLAKYIITSKIKKKKQNKNKKIENNNESENENDLFNDDEENNEDEQSINNNYKASKDDSEIETEENNKEKKECAIENEGKSSIFSFQNLKIFTLELTFYVLDTGFTYLTVCLILLFINNLEQSMFISWSYYLLLFILLKKVNIFHTENSHLLS